MDSLERGESVADNKPENTPKLENKLEENVLTIEGENSSIPFETLHGNTQNEISESVENLKQAVIDKLENIFRTPRVEKLDATIDERVDSGEKIRSLVEETSPLKDLANCYMQERQEILHNVMSGVMSDKSDGAAPSVEHQIKIWADVATDLDTYYLTLLNKSFRIGRADVGEIHQSILLTYRVSESVVDDLRKHGNRLMFSSQQDIHDDQRLGRFSKDSFGSSENSIHDLVESLLARTNTRRQMAVDSSGRGRMLCSNSESVDEMVNCDRKWSESSCSQISLQNDDPNVRGECQITTEYDTQQMKTDDVVTVQLKNEVSTYRVYINDQQNELQNRQEIIEQLKNDNLEIMIALETYEKYMLRSDNKSMQRLEKIRRRYEVELKEKKSEIDRLQMEMNDTKQMHGEVRKSSQAVCEGQDIAKVSKLIQERNNLEESFKNASLHLQRLTEAADVYQKEIKEHLTTDKLFDNQGDEADKSDRYVTERSFNDVLHRMTDKLLGVLSKLQCEGTQKGGLNMPSSLAATVEYLVSQLLETFDSAWKENVEMKSELDLIRKGVDRKAFETLGDLFMKSKHKLVRLAAQKRDQQDLLNKKDNEIECQNEALRQSGTGINNVLLQKQDIDGKLERALADLAVAKDEANIAREELQQLTVLQEGKTIENERLVQYIFEDNHKMDVCPSYCSSSINARYLNTRGRCCKNCNAGRNLFIDKL